MKISVCGKGGSGKSTLVSLLAHQAAARGLQVLVVDADDSNTGIFQMLGFRQPPTPLMELVGGKRKLQEKMRRPDILTQDRITFETLTSPYVCKQNWIHLVSIGKILQSLEGCACPMGALNREFLSKLTLAENQIAIVDMEAGVEHFGRGIETNIDTIMLTVAPSMESIAVAEKIKHLAAGIQKNLLAVLNNISSTKVAIKLESELKQRDINVIGVIREDPFVFEACLEGRALDRGKAFDTAGRILEALISNR